MATDNGERVLDELLMLGYEIELADDGKITATKAAQQTLHGKAQHSRIEWIDRSLVYHIAEQTYVEKLRRRVAAGRAKLAPRLAAREWGRWGRAPTLLPDVPPRRRSYAARNPIDRG